MGSILNVGIAGFGVVGRRRKQIIDDHPHFKVVAVADRTLSDTLDAPDGIRRYARFEDLIERESLDVLFVCLTNDVAARATIAGLEKGAHVFCEKPPGRTVQELCTVIECEKRHPRQKLKYGFNHRYHDSVRDALKLIRGGDLGKVIDIRGVYGKSQIVSFGSDWRTKRSVAGGGILLDQGIHMVDLIRLFGGELTEIHSVISNTYWNHDVEDNAYALMKSSEGAVVFLHSSATQWRHRFHLDITLEKGSILLEGILSGSKTYGEETITVAHKGKNDQGTPREIRTSYNEDNSWRDEIFEFADCIVHDKPVIHGSSLEALKTMHLVFRIYCADPQWKKKYNLSDEITGAVESRPNNPAIARDRRPDGTKEFVDSPSISL